MSTYSTTSATPFILPISGLFATDTASPGTVTGTARVIVSLDGQERLARGEILVCPATMPPWTRRLRSHLHKWYNYDWTSHIITSKNHSYALKTNTGEVVLLTFVSYYCDDGSPGCVTFRYRYVQDR